MANSLVIFTEEGIKRIITALGELPAKLSHELLNDVDSQLNLIKTDVKSYVAMIEQHLAPHKAEAAVAAAKTDVAAEVAKVETVVADVAAAV